MFEFLHNGEKAPESEDQREGEEGMLSLEEAAAEARGIMNVFQEEDGSIKKPPTRDEIETMSQAFDETRARMEQRNKLLQKKKHVEELRAETGKSMQMLFEEYVRQAETLDPKELKAKTDELFPDTDALEEVENLYHRLNQDGENEKAKALFRAWGIHMED